jgi:uncharacterized protein YceK
MKRILVGTLVIVTLVIVTLVIVVGCGTVSTSTKPVKPDNTKAKASQAGVGDTLQIAGNDSKLAVTLSHTKRLPAASMYGTQVHPALYAVELTVKNLGGKVYDDSVTNCVTLVDTKDQGHDADFAVSDANGNMLAGQLDTVKIAPGDKRSGWVFFDLKAKQTPRTLQFTADSGFGPVVGEWSLH